MPIDVATDPKSCLIAVTIELHEHPIARAARVLRESGVTPAQVMVGVQLALGKIKPAIADHLGIKISSVRDSTEKIYQTLDVHNAAELGTKIWLGQEARETRLSGPLGHAAAPCKPRGARSVAKQPVNRAIIPSGSKRIETPLFGAGLPFP
jgi:DNA-binding CsgD family transcriptional regulator